MCLERDQKNFFWYFLPRGRLYNFFWVSNWVCSGQFNQSVRSRGMSLVGSRIFFDLLRKGKENLFSFSTFSLGQPYNGQDATLFESHWRRRREQKIVLKAGFFKCHVSLQRGTPTLVSVVAESKQERGENFKFSFSFLYQIF